MNDYIEMALKTIFLFIYLHFVTRIIGRKQMSQLTFFDYIVGITIGSLTAAVISNKKLHLLNAIVPVAIFTALAILIGYIDLKNFRFRKIADGGPLIIIYNGNVKTGNMKKARYNMGDLLMQLRQNKVFDISQVQYAFLESNGKLSVLKKSEFTNVTKKDMNIQSNSYLIKDLIMDGMILKKNLKMYDIKKDWVYNELKNKYNIFDIKKIAYAGLKEDGSFQIIISE